MVSTTSLTSRVIAVFIVGVAIAQSASAPPDDACSLLTPAQVSAAVGVPVGAGTYVMPTFRKTCTWSATTNGGGTITLNLQSLDQFQSEKKSASYGQPVSAADGIGDEAYYSGTANLVSLIVKKGNVAFKVAVYAHMPIEKRQAAERSLALQVISRL
jgi:hypothetical protein